MFINYECRRAEQYTSLVRQFTRERPVEVVRVVRRNRARRKNRIDLKFLTKPGKSATESFRSLTDVYGDDVTSRSRVFERHERFREGVDDLGRVDRIFRYKGRDKD